MNAPKFPIDCPMCGSQMEAVGPWGITIEDDGPCQAQRYECPNDDKCDTVIFLCVEQR